MLVKWTPLTLQLLSRSIGISKETQKFSTKSKTVDLSGSTNMFLCAGLKHFNHFSQYASKYANRSKNSCRKPNSIQLTPVFHRITPPVSDLVSNSTTICPPDLDHKISSCVKADIFSQLSTFTFTSPGNRTSQHSFHWKHPAISSFCPRLASFQSQFVENTGSSLCALWCNLNLYIFSSLCVKSMQDPEILHI